MSWIIDILALLLVFGLGIYGYRRGFFNSTINLLLVIVVIFGAIALAVITTTSFLAPLGVVDELYYAFLSLLGNSKIEGGQEIVEQVAYYLSMGILIVLLTIIYDVVLHFVRKLILGLFNNTLFKLKIIKFIDKLLGLIVNLAISLAIVFGFMAFVYNLSQDGFLFVYTNELLKSCEVLGIFYDINPLNEILTF